VVAYRRFLDDPLVREFVGVVGGGRVDCARWIVYGPLRGVSVLCRVAGVSPSELVERIRGGDGCDDVWKRFFAYLKERGYTGVTANRLLTGIRGFLKYFDVSSNVDWDRVNELKRRVFGAGVKRNIFARLEGEVTKDMIRRILLDACKSNRDRVLILVMATSGISFGDALKLRIGNFENLWEEKECYRLDYVRSKTGIKVTTFITRECRDRILMYLDERQKSGEIITSDSPLFANKLGAKEALKRSNAIKILRRIFDAAGLNEVVGVDAHGEKRYKYHPHLLRKYFRTALRNAKVDRIYAEAMMGHDIDAMFGVEMVYDKQAKKPDVLREQYIKALPELTFLQPIEVKGLAIAPDELEQLYQRLNELEAKLKLLYQLEERGIGARRRR